MPDIIALASTIVFNCVLSLFVSDLFLFGWFIAPLIGGIVRSLIAHKKDVRYIIGGIVLLDALVFVPIVIVITDGVSLDPPI